MRDDDSIDRAEIRYELWEDGDGLVFFPETSDSFRAMLSPDARMVWSCSARSWEEAQARKHEHLGWGPYVLL